MPIFISYSHQDKDFTDNLARNLVGNKHNIWIDTWEINAGESLIDKIQNAIDNADAILVILSKYSTTSEWCKKELNSGLLRELEEKKVLLIPCVVDDCNIPLFLKEKLYIDFRKDTDYAIELLNRSLSKITNTAQSRIEKNNYHTDWTIDWDPMGKTPIIEWIFVDHGPSIPYSIVTRLGMIFCNKKAIQIFRHHLENGQHLVYANNLLEHYLENEKSGEYRVTIKDTREIKNTDHFKWKSGEKIIINTGIRRLGFDNGMDTLFNVDNILRRAIKHHLGVTRHKD